MWYIVVVVILNGQVKAAPLEGYSFPNELSCETALSQIDRTSLVVSTVCVKNTIKEAK